MNVLPVLDAVLARLREKLPQLQVEYFPEKPSEYRLNHSVGALLLSYAQVPERTLIELTSEEMDFDSPATVNTRVVDSCIRYADELIDAHLRGRYILPLAEIPTVLRDIAITLVRYRLYARRPEGDLPDTVKDDHKEALRQLRELRDNRLTLGLPSTQKDVPEPGEFRVRSRPATFGGRDGLLEKY